MAKPIYDPFSWNAPGNTLQDLYNWYLSGEDEATDDTGGGGGDPAAGGENYSVLRPDPSTVRLPTGSPYPSWRCYVSRREQERVPLCFAR